MDRRSPALLKQEVSLAVRDDSADESRTTNLYTRYFIYLCLFLLILLRYSLYVFGALR
jgi:hypothetical protein